MKNLEYLSSLCEEKTTFSFRLMRFCTQKTAHSDFFESFLLLIEYLQLVSQTFLIYAYSESTQASTKLGSLAQTFTKAFDWTYFIDEDWSSLITTLSVIIFSALVVIRLIVFLYIVYISVKSHKGSFMLIDLWRWVYHIQGRIFCFLVCSFWVGLLRYQYDGLDSMSKGVSNLIKGIFWTLIIVEYVSSIIFHKYLTCALPTKDLLSCKTNTLVLLTLSQKFMIQILHGFISPDGITPDPWIYTLIGFAFDLLRIYHFLNVLPFYRSKGLYLQGNLLIVVFAFNLSAIVYSILLASDYSVDINFLLVVWILLIIIGIIGIKNYLKRLIVKILTNEKQKLPELLSHKVFLMKEFKDQDINQDIYCYDWKALLSGSIHTDIKGISEVRENKDTNSLKICYSKKSVNQFCVQYLTDLSTKFPQYEMLDLYKAYFYAKKLKSFPRALRLLGELQRSSSHIIQFNVFLLLDDIQSILRALYENSKTRLDVFTYTRSVCKVAELKQKMHKQAQLTLTIYKEMQQSFPNLSYIFDTAQKISYHRSLVDEHIKYINETVPDCYLEPVIVYAHYNLVLNHLIPEHLESMKKFSEKSIKYKKYFDSRNICPENLFHQDTGFMFLSGRKEDLCKITYSSEHVKQLYGREPVGQYLYTFISPFIRPFYKKVLTYSFETGEGMAPNATGPVFLHNPNTGYIMPVSHFLNIHPLIWEGLHYVTISRHYPKSLDFIFLSESGEIYAFTEGIAKKLGLASIVEANSSIGTPIEKICPGLVEPGRAFSLIGRLPADQLKQIEDPVIQNAKRIYDSYSTAGEIVQMNPLESFSENDLEENPGSKEIYSFQCTIANRSYGTLLIKILTLEEIKQENSLIIEPKVFKKSPYTQEEQIVMNEKRNTPLNSAKDHNYLLSEEDALVLNTRLNTEFKSPRKAFKTEQEELLTSNPDRTPRKPQSGKQSTIQQPGLTAYAMSQRKESIESIEFDKGKIDMEIDKIDTYSVNSQKSASNSNLRKMKAFNTELATKYYPRKYTVYILLFFIGLCFMLIDQSILKVRMDTYVNSLNVRKDVVSEARTRRLKLTDLHRALRALWVFGTGKLLQSDVSPGARVPAHLNRMKQYVTQLSQSNRDLRTTVDHLDSNIGQVIFQKGVRMYETDYDDANQRYINLTNFEAVDDIISSSLKVISTATLNLSNAVPKMEIMLRNIPNDILIQTGSVINVLISSLDSDMQDNLNLINVCVWSILAFLIVLYIVLNYMLYAQYKAEKGKMIAVQTLDLDTNRTIQSRLQRFTQLIEDGVSFEGLPSVDISKFYYRRNLDQSRRKKLRKQEPDSYKSLRGIRKKYTFYAIKLFILMSCIIVLIVLSGVFAQNRSKSLNTQTNQLQLINSLNENLAFLASIAVDLVATNDTSYVANMKPSIALPFAIEYLSKRKNLLLSSFEVGSKELEIVSPFFYQNQCYRLSPDMRMFCTNLTNNQQNTGFIYLVTYVESIFSNFRDRFNSSDKSSNQTLKAFLLEVQTYIIPRTIAVGLLGSIISQAVDDNLDNSISSYLSRTTLIVYLFCFLLALICFLIYKYILAKVRESDNQFRKVLQVFPANTILSNFILKSFLLKAAKGALDFIKNEL